MRLLLALLALYVLHHTTAEEASWSWGSNDKNETPQKASNEPLPETVPRSLNPTFLQDEEILIAEPSEYTEDIKANSTEAELVIDEILSSTKKGRAIDGFDEVYSDPNVQEALQKGDDSEARNVIKDRLCALGLMQCDGVEEKRPFYSPEELIYAQPVSINPVGKPIATIPIKGHRGVGYGPPKPLHYPSRPLPPSGKFPPSSISPNKFGPPPTYIQPGKPPRRQFGGPPSKPFYGKPGLNGEVYEAGEYFSKPPSFAPGLEFVQPIEPEIPYKFEQGASQFGTHKDKRVEITVNAQGGHAGALGSSSAAKGTVEHVHHHYHHNLDNNKPVVVNPAPLAAAAVTTSDLSSGTFGTNSFGSSGTYNSFKPSIPISASTTAGLGNFGSSNGFLASNTFGSTNGFSQASYGGQPIANYGVKPITENYQDQGYESFGASVGSYGSTGLYKKELNLNSVNNNYLQANYADKYQGVESARAENYDCICVPYDQCPSHDVIGRKDDLYLPLDPRNLKSDIEALSDEERVITDGNGTMTVVIVNKDTGLSGANITEVTEESKRISKRDTSEVDAKVNGGDGKPEARQGNYGSLGNLDMKKIKPTFGVSFGLPQQGGGVYPVNPYGPTPFSNPYPIGQPGINLGLVSVNPLVSIQVTKDDYGNKEIKPFVNLHVTPNDYLIHKFSDFFNYKKAVIFNKHKHYHVHKGNHYPHHSHYPQYIQSPHEVYREHPHEFEPHYPAVHGPPIFEGPHDGGPHNLHNSFPEQYPNTYEGPIPGSYFDNPLNYGGGEYYPGPLYGKNIGSSNEFVEGNSVLQQYQNQASRGAEAYGEENNAEFQNSRRFRVGKNLNIDNTSSNPIRFPTNRKRRDVRESENDKKLSKRQFYGGNNLVGRPQTCGPRHVCCKRPLRPQVPHPNRQCGTRHSQGINGRIKNPVYIDGDSEFGEYPWQVAILKKDSKESVYVCGGTLIDPLHILTAAHCVKTYTGFDLRARLGEWDVNHDVEFYPYIERDVVSVHVHPEFYAGTLYNDIAILRMDKPVDWSKSPHISPACLPHPQDDYTGARCWTTGWGKDAFGDFGKYQNILKEVDVPIVDSGICQRQLQQTRLGYDFKLHPGFICAGGEEGKDACKGDGGGPMVCERGGTWQVVGLVSWGIGCGQTGVPGVYVKVGYYLDWIRQITQRY
ncbi:uncharacterized protein [Diabrotica undecimpunctata]|uniref:uncharacterized protein isoform X1 n=1 Tax=Diabrotica undecimpunctata TaxID=50387 RepID=UPI003B63E13C